MNATSPKSSLVKLGLHTNKQKTLKVMVLGQSGVGKTGKCQVFSNNKTDTHLLTHFSLFFCLLAMVVRFITRRFIGEYDPNLEKIYTCQTTLDKEAIQFDILDATGQLHVRKYIN